MGNDSSKVHHAQQGEGGEQGPFSSFSLGMHRALVTVIKPFLFKLSLFAWGKN